MLLLFVFASITDIILKLINCFVLINVYYMIIFVLVLLSIGIKESSRFNNVCTVMNLLTIITVIIACAFKGEFK